MTEHQRVIDAFSPAQLYAALLATYPQQVHAIERRDNLLFTLTDALLIHVLSFAWRDAARLARCSKRIHGLVQQRAFWEPAIRERMRVMLLTMQTKQPPDLTADEVEFFSTRWTPFDEWLLPKLCQRVGWLFSHLPTGEAKLSWYPANVLSIERRGKWRIEWQSANAIARPGAFSAKFASYSKNYKRSTHYWDPDQTAGLLRTETHQDEVPVVRLHDGVFNVLLNNNVSRARWQGASIRKTLSTSDTHTSYKYMPHGEGKWTNYDTGELILEGDDVAFAGKIHDGVTWFAGKCVSEPIQKRAKTDE